MEDGDHDESLPDSEPGCEEGEKNSLDEEGDDPVDGHDYSDRLDCKTEAAGNIEGRIRDIAGGDPLILQKNGEQVVVTHAMICEDAERDNYHGYLPREDFRWGDGCWTRRAIGIKRPFLCFVNVNGIQRAIGVRAKIDSIISCSSSSHKGCFRSGMVQLFLCTPWLHIWVSLDQEEVAEQDADQEDSGA